MTTRMLINATVADELRIAIVEDGELIELDIETTDQNQLRGNIYKGVVHNVEQSLAACFVDIGGHKQGFLPFDEITPNLYGRKVKDGENVRITDVIKRGQEIVVQVMKDAVGEKGATLTTHLSIPGRFTVLMPGSDASGVSRKIEDETARKKIRAIAAKIERPEDCGFIVRTAGLGQGRTAIQKDLNLVIALYEKVQKSASIARAPSLLYAEPDLISRTLRDFFSDEIDEVWIDSREEYEAARSYFEELMPDFVERIQWYQNPIPIFAYYHVEEQIEATFHRQVPLPSGGSIVIDETEALVAIDVNSGKNTSERDHEDTVYKTNLEAAEEVARQLKLRDLGGIIVVDFIDMELRKNERSVEKALAEAAKLDKARYKISKINAQGLCVLTRQRIRQGMRRAFQRRCSVCAGTGWLRTPESHSLSLLRRVETRLAQGGVGEVRVATHRETAEFILNHKRSELMALEREYHCRIIITARLEMDRDADDVVFLSKGEMLAEITDRLPPREERRDLRGLRRRRKKKKALAAVAGEAEAHEELDEAEATDQAARSERSERAERKEKRKKRRRDREGREGREKRAAEAPVEGQAEAVATPVEGGEAPAPAPRAERASQPEEPGRFDGTGAATFTGRPPPEVLERLREQRRQRLARAGRGGTGAAAASGGGTGDLAPTASPRPTLGEPALLGEPVLLEPVPLEALAAAVAVDPATVAPRQGLDPASPAASLEGAVAVQAPVAPVVVEAPVGRGATEPEATREVLAAAPLDAPVVEEPAATPALDHEQPIRAPSALEAELEARSAPAALEAKAEGPAERPKRPSLFDRIGLGRTPSQDNDA